MASGSAVSESPGSPMPGLQRKGGLGRGLAALIPTAPMGVPVGFGLGPQVTVEKAFMGPLVLRERLGSSRRGEGTARRPPATGRREHATWCGAHSGGAKPRVTRFSSER